MLEGQRAPRELAEHGMVASSAPLFMSFNFIISFFFFLHIYSSHSFLSFSRERSEALNLLVGGTWFWHMT